MMSLFIVGMLVFTAEAELLVDAWYVNPKRIAAPAPFVMAVLVTAIHAIPLGMISIAYAGGTAINPASADMKRPTS